MGQKLASVVLGMVLRAAVRDRARSVQINFRLSSLPAASNQERTVARAVSGQTSRDFS